MNQSVAKGVEYNEKLCLSISDSNDCCMISTSPACNSQRENIGAASQHLLLAGNFKLAIGYCSPLGVQPLGAQSKIREAHEKLALQLHSDRNQTVSARAEF